MAELKISISDEIEFLKGVPNIDWTLLFNKFLISKLERIRRLKRCLLKSQLTEEDIEEFTDKINTALSERYLKSE